MTQPAPVPTAPEATPTPTPAPTASGGISQDEVNRIATREKDEGRKAALAQVAADLGVDLETAKTMIATARKQTDSEKTESQRERDAATAEKTAAATEKTAATKERHDARVDRAFMAAGLMDEAKIARYSRLLETEVGASLEDVKKAVEALKKDEPALFGPAAPLDPKKPPAPGGDPTGGPPKQKQSEDAFSRGRDRALGHRSQFTAQVERTPAKT